MRLERVLQAFFCFSFYECFFIRGGFHLSTIAFFVLANKFKKITNPRVVRHFYPAKYCPVADAIERIYKDYDVRVDCRIFRRAEFFSEDCRGACLLLRQCVGVSETFKIYTRRKTASQLLRKSITCNA